MLDSAIQSPLLLKLHTCSYYRKVLMTVLISWTSGALTYLCLLFSLLANGFSAFFFLVLFFFGSNGSYYV